ncbi:hypothetical protein DKX38_004862 [Salix brachista]|uniref:Uncharacterized protein n=1 Tax=Salix brachista TaxID=2182728 RepID=A0A5N5NCN8_9ROSI|nr:hypothetical protein DKX38_004862 [Salix brachista]
MSNGHFPCRRHLFLFVILGDFLTEFVIALQSLDHNPTAFVIILSGNGDHFFSGIDIKTLHSITRRSWIEELTDIVIACYIWFCSKDAFFSAKEFALGLTADSWTLQRFSGIVEYGNAMDFSSSFIYWF